MANFDLVPKAPPNGESLLGHGEGFNHTRFNEVFQTHRMWNPEDDGYGEQMVQSEYDKTKQYTPDEMLQMRERDFLSHGSGANQGVVAGPAGPSGARHQFNHQLFEEQARQTRMTADRHGSTSLVVRTEPEEMTMFRSPTRCVGSLRSLRDLPQGITTPLASPFGGRDGFFAPLGNFFPKKV